MWKHVRTVSYAADEIFENEQAMDIKLHSKRITIGWRIY